MLEARFFCTDNGTEPVRDWLKTLTAIDRKAIGEDIRTVQIGWPLGMPLVRKMDTDLWEIRIHLQGRIARVLFTLVNQVMVLLHGFIKKTQTTPKQDLDLAKARRNQVRGA
jgi:phage-related protein